MKIKELLESANVEFPQVLQNSMPYAITSPGMDQYYEYYRFLIAIAGFPGRDIPVDGPIHDGPLMVPYTDIERQHTENMLRKMGKQVKHVVPQGSKESNHRNTTSPVRKFVDPDGEG